MEKEERQNEWDEKLIKTGAHFTQSRLYLDWQKAIGYKTFEIEINDKDNSSLFRGVERFLPWGQKFIYSPHGPFIEKEDSDLKYIKDKLLELGQTTKALFIRYDLPGNSNPQIPGSHNLNNSFYRHSNIQPRNEWLIKAVNDEELAFKKLPGKTRYLINKAERQGFEIETTDEPVDYLQDFYKIMKQTATRQGFSLHPEEYYRAALSLSTPQTKPFLTIARKNNEIVCMHLNIIFGQKSFYVFGGSRDSGNASYLTIWNSLLKISKEKCLDFNLGGINGPDNLNPEWNNLSIFKKKFPGEILCHNPSYDLPLKPLAYLGYKTFKKIKR